MTPFTTNRVRRGLTALLGAFLLVGVPLGATAEHGNGRGDVARERGGDAARYAHDSHRAPRYGRHDHHRLDHRRDRRHHRHLHRRHGQRGYPVYVHGRSHRNDRHRPAWYQGEPGYYCASCSHRFRSHGALRSHVHDHHRVPVWRLPGVIVHSVFGWVFHG